MLTLNEIKLFFPPSLHRFPRFMLREYLQYKILEIVFNSHFSNALCFMGGTCLRIVHGNLRFSEDIDFDNLRLEQSQFSEWIDRVKTHLEREGYAVEVKSVVRGAWHCLIKFPGILFEEGLSDYKEEKIQIRLDLESQKYQYIPEKVILNKFEVFTTIFTVPLPVLLAQKFFAILNRTWKLGRDFYDVVFLLGRNVKPDYEYLKLKAGIDNPEDLKESVLSVCRMLDMERLAKDLEPFLFDLSHKSKITLFPEYIAGIL